MKKKVIILSILIKSLETDASAIIFDNKTNLNNLTAIIMATPGPDIHESISLTPNGTTNISLKAAFDDIKEDLKNYPDHISQVNIVVGAPHPSHFNIVCNPVLFITEKTNISKADATTYVITDNPSKCEGVMGEDNSDEAQKGVLLH